MKKRILVLVALSLFLSTGMFRGKAVADEECMVTAPWVCGAHAGQVWNLNLSNNYILDIFWCCLDSSPSNVCDTDVEEEPCDQFRLIGRINPY